MSAAAAPVTVEQFLGLPEDPAFRQELIGGEVITMARAGQPHETAKMNFTQQLAVYFHRNPIGSVWTETGYRLGPHDAPQPDVSVILEGRLHEDNTGAIQICPDIAIEVVSSETAAFLRTKVKLYLQYGCRAVVVAYPDLRMIQIYTTGGVRELSGEEALEVRDILPGFSVPASAFFVGLPKLTPARPRKRT